MHGNYDCHPFGSKRKLTITQEGMIFKSPMVSLFVNNHFLQKVWSRWEENVKQWGLCYTSLHVPAWCSMAISLGIIASDVPP